MIRSENLALRTELSYFKVLYENLRKQVKKAKYDPFSHRIYLIWLHNLLV